MANRTVSIFYSVRVNGQHHRLKPVLGKNHKVRPEWAVFKGADTHLPGGSYALGWYEGTRRVWRDVGPNPQDAVEAADRQRVSLAAVRVGLPIQKTDDASLLLQTAVSSYLEEYRLMRTDESLQLVRHTLNDFVSHSKRIYLRDVTRMDLLKFADWLQKVKKNKPRTANNKFMRVHQFLKTNKIELVTGKDAPKFVEERPEIYEDEEQLTKFFGECTFPQLVTFKTFLMAGLRMQELMFLQWTDIDLKELTIAVTAKPERGFIPKAYHERRVSVPTELVNMLGEWQRWAKPKTPTELVFPTKSAQPNDKLLQTCKRLARRAGLNCGHCDTCVARKECRDWFLHKFRATFATRLLQGGMDLESVREQMGHKDIESISRYLVPLKGKAMRAKVEDVWNKKPVPVPLGHVEFKNGKFTVKTQLD